jgi:hypothetical protein
MSIEQELKLLREENARLKAEQAEAKTSLRVSESGYVEVYGIPGKGKYSLSATPEGWTSLAELMPKILEFAKANKALIEARHAHYRANRPAKAVG